MMRSDFARKVLATCSTQGVVLGMNTLCSILIARALGPSLRGVYATALAICALGIQFGNLGLHASNSYYVAQDKSLLAPIVGNTLFLSVFIGGLSSLLLVLFPQISPVNGFPFFIALLWIPLGLLHLLFQNILIGLQEVRRYNRTELVSKCTYLSLVLILFYFHQLTLNKALVLGLFSVGIGLTYTALQLFPLMQERPFFSFPLLKRSFWYGLKAYGSAFFSFLLLRSGLVMVKYLLGFEQAGYYSVVTSMIELASLVPALIGLLLFPKLSALANPREQLLYAHKIARAIFLFMTPCCLLFFFFGTSMIESIFGALFLPAVTSFLWAIPGILFLSVNVVYMNYFASLGMPAIAIYSPAFASCLNVLIGMVYIPKIGIQGASLAFTLSFGLMLALSALYISRHHHQLQPS